MESRSTAGTPAPAPRREQRLTFLVLPHVHALDLSGPVQVFYEAGGFGVPYRLRYCGVTPEVRTAQGFTISKLEPLPEVAEGDLVVVPGISSATLDRLDHVPAGWLRGALEAGARICSICTGAFVLAHAGLLDHRRCTTHWKVAELLERRHPKARVLRDRLFVRDGGVTTSAGVTSGIDTALSMVEADHGPLVAAKVARELVVFLRRDGSSDQTSIYLDYRTHLHPGVHRVQDWLVRHPEERPNLEQLAAVAGMSPRHLTRTFRQATGITLKTFANKLKLEVAENLLRSPRLTVDAVASRCGFNDARQLRRLFHERYGVSPSEWKERQLERISR